MLGVTLLTSCAALSKQRLVSGIAEVTIAPPSPAYLELQRLARLDPLLANFLRTHGAPDRIIQDIGTIDCKVVMYYLKPNKAWLFTLQQGFHGGSNSLSGPSTIGKKTRELFDAMDRLKRATANLSSEQQAAASARTTR
jgi:hypothetical protein